ncbi:hypothetical protein G7Z17_g848 [Cylindrodendrum hubeiense]|uniref:Uncharacterized protein n=1 Tax=Cylindrodendrum hubeiense TaxID=595255 RepID=A0A9P5LFX2_9HYPO|nr:hypothetical protein G7Z17_g848 [Cylindrodendrum hubeiense]
MFSKMFTPAVASLAGLSSLVGVATAHPFQGAESLMARDSAETVLAPMTNWGGIGADPNAELYDWDTFYWSNGNVVANLTCTGGEDHKMLNVARMGDEIQGLDCSNPGKLTMTFKDNAAKKSAKHDWKWLHAKKEHTMVLVVDGGECGGPDGRKQYAVSDVHYDGSDPIATLYSSPTTWEDLVDDYTLRVRSGAFDNDGQSLSKRIGGSGSVDIANDFSKNLFSQDFNGVTLSVDCAHCATTGSIDFDFEIGLFSGLTGSVTARNGLGASVGLGVTASGELTAPVDIASIRILNLPLTPISIAGIATFGPEINVDAKAGLSAISGQVSADFGVAMVIPDGTTLRIGGDSDAINPQFSKIGPTISASVQVTASLGPVITFDIAATVFGKGLVAGLGLAAPKLDATLTASASTAGGVCGINDAIAGVELDVNVGVELNLFGGFGSAADQPNAKTIFSTSTPIFDTCLVITTGSTQGAVNGNDGIRPKVGTVTYTDGSQADLFNSGANSDDTPINPLSDTQDIQSITIDGGVGLAECAISTSFIDTNIGCGPNFFLFVAAGTTADVPSDLAKSTLCMRCPNLV